MPHAYEPRPAASVVPDAVSIAARELRIPASTVLEGLTLPWETLVQRGSHEPESGCLEPRQHPRHPLCSACVRVPVSDPRQAYLFYLVRIPSDLIVCSEPCGDIRSHPSFPAYVEMLRAGHEAPYSTLFEIEKPRERPDGGQAPLYVTTNRRRCLAAQAVGSTITGWLNVNCAQTGLPLKLGDVLRSYGAALETLAHAAPERDEASHLECSPRERAERSLRERA